MFRNRGPTLSSLDSSPRFSPWRRSRERKPPRKLFSIGGFSTYSPPGGRCTRVPSPCVRFPRSPRAAPLANLESIDIIASCCRESVAPGNDLMVIGFARNAVFLPVFAFGLQPRPLAASTPQVCLMLHCSRPPGRPGCFPGTRLVRIEIRCSSFLLQFLRFRPLPVLPSAVPW